MARCRPSLGNWEAELRFIAGIDPDRGADADTGTIFSKELSAGKCIAINFGTNMRMTIPPKERNIAA